MVALIWIVMGCGSKPAPEAEPEPVEYALSDATMYRLTDAELRATLQATFGIPYDGPLPNDFVLHGYRSVGAASLTINPSEFEAYEQAAWAVATTAIPDSAAVRERLGCSPATPLGHARDADRGAPCVASGLAPLATQAWRRPVRQSELDRLVELWDWIHDVSDSEVVATRAVFAALVMAPEFLFRVEVGEPDPEGLDGVRRFTAWELASRLSYVLTDAPPDAALRAAAASGALHQPDVLLEHAERLFDSAAGRAALGRFWEETLELDRLDNMVKDPDAYPEFDASLREAMRSELLRLFEHVVFETDAPFGSLLTTDVTFTDEALGELYGVAAGEGSLAGSGRGGILGRAALLSIWSHATSSSPTLRGKFVRTRMLCQAVPPPPEGVVASLEGVTGEGSARERLSAHVEDPACRGCHEIMDPPGFAFEHFDAIGRWRDTENGYPIDPSGNLDGVPFTDAEGLGAAVAAHPEFPTCVALQWFRHAMGAAETQRQLGTVERLGQGFADSNQSLKALVLAFIASDAFHRATPADGRTVDDDCGSGVELCNGLDDDCDGQIDEDVVEVCEADGTWGVSDCALASCDLPWPEVEVCNGLDDDGDGLVDEGDVVVTPVPWAELGVDCQADEDTLACRQAMTDRCASCGAAGFVTSVRDATAHAVTCVSSGLAQPVATTFDELGGHHQGCSGSQALGPECNAAIHRLCTQRGHATGWGPVDHDGDAASVVCVDDAAVIETDYAILLSFEPACDGAAERMGSACNRAFHRFCQSNGYASGFGPLENDGDTAVAACLGEVP